MIPTDCLIIGAGPCGLFQVFELGLLGIKAHLVDALPKAGGQCSELYPEKPIYDIPAYPIIGAQELVEKLMQQIHPFGPTFHFGQQVTELRAEGDAFQVATSAGTRFTARSVVIAAGVGAFQPVLLRLDGLDRFHDSQIFYRVRDAAQHAGKHIVVLGGGDSALDWALALLDKAASMTLIHRSDKFRAQTASVEKMHAFAAQGRLKFLTGHVHGYTEESGQLAGLKLKDNAGAEHVVPAQHVLVFYGLSPKLGPIAEWGLNLNKHTLVVDTEKFESSVPGIHAVGDINTYPGKKKLILSGFHEAALAAFAIKQRLNPGEKVHLQYTTTSPLMHQRLGVETPKD
ncbi:MAG TPA: NAD(P)/FAD-dependent oxidoreductase [Candidatus Binatia bacterium]|nr:NAD(P)/FAD-dependent oxidoreductase [Candidatus Binatia bacterium]